MRILYAGTFCPPTYGHAAIVRSAAKLFPQLEVICSVNPEKSGVWATPDQCVALWKSYDIPGSVRVMSLEQSMKNKDRPIVLVRGLRTARSLDDEVPVVMLNHKDWGISDYFFIVAEDRYSNISSSLARDSAERLNFQVLAECVSPPVVTYLLEKVLKIKRLTMVVGKPASGKSTVLKSLAGARSDVHIIFTDDFAPKLSTALREKFGETVDLQDLWLNREKEAEAVIKDRWFMLLGEALRAAPQNSYVFVEIGYGLRPTKKMYRFLGHRIVYIGCEDPEARAVRLNGRGTPQHEALAAKIPDWLESTQIAKENGLDLRVIDTSPSKIHTREVDMAAIVSTLL
jgi:pantetheine-phosphate adenylyltransferase